MQTVTIRFRCPNCGTAYLRYGCRPDRYGRVKRICPDCMTECVYTITKEKKKKGNGNDRND